MYLNQVLSISKVANGYIVEVMAPSKGEPDFAEGRGRQIICKDIAEVGEKVQKLLPTLGDEDAKSEFDRVFQEAVK